MPVNVSTGWSTQDQAALVAQIRRAQDLMGMSVSAAVKRAAKHVTNSLGVATKQAPKKRKAVVNVTRERVIKADGKPGRVRVTKQYGVMKWRNGAPKFVAVPGATSNADVNKSKQAIITRRGLARASWRWAAKAVRGKVSNVAANFLTNRVAKSYVSVQINPSKNAPRIRIKNALKYIAAAIEGGSSGIDDAMRKAASGMEKSLTKQLETAAKVAEGKVTSAAFAAEIVRGQMAQENAA